MGAAILTRTVADRSTTHLNAPPWRGVLKVSDRADRSRDAEVSASHVAPFPGRPVQAGGPCRSGPSMMKTRWISAAMLLVAFHTPAMAEGEPSIYESATPPAREPDRSSRLRQVVVAGIPAGPLLRCRLRPTRATSDSSARCPPRRRPESSSGIRTRSTLRTALIDRLLERGEFADYWAMRWGDVLRIKAEFPINLWPNAAQAYHRWVRASLAENKPYDRFVRELLTSSGSNFRVGPVNFYRAVQNRAPEGIAAAVALTLHGDRVPTPGRRPFAGHGRLLLRRSATSRLASGRKRASSGIRSIPAPGRKRRPRETCRRAKLKSLQAEPLPPSPLAPLDRDLPRRHHDPVAPDRDPREVFADWLITPGEPLVHAVDRQPCLVPGCSAAASSTSRTTSAKITRRQSRTAGLPGKELVAGRYDLKRLYRLILNSRRISSLRRHDPLIRGPRPTSPATRCVGWMPRC